MITSTNIEYVSRKSTHIKMIRSPLVVLMVEGGMTSIDRGENQILTLDPAKFSFDPDLNPSDEQHISFDWWCKRKGEVYPTLPNGDLSRENPQTPYTIEELALLDDSQNDGGCSRRGPGPLNVPSGKLDFAMNNLQANNSYLFTIDGIKGERRTRAELEVNVIEGNPPAIVLECLNTALCFPKQGGMLYNPDNRLAVVGKCGDDCSDDMDFQWKLDRAGLQGSWININVELNHHITGSSSSQISIDSMLFQEDIERFGMLFDYSLTLKVNHSLASGESSTRLFVNHPPSSGTCNISSLTGFVGKTTYEVQCWDWQDQDDGHYIERYSIYADDDLIPHIIEDDKMQFKLPLGKVVDTRYLLNVKVHIRDNFGGVARYDLGDIESRPDEIEEVKRYVEELANTLQDDGNQDLISTTHAQGDLIEMASVYNSVGTVLNTYQTQTSNTYSSVEDVLNNPDATEEEKKAAEELQVQMEVERDERTQVREKMVESLESMPIESTGEILLATSVLSTATGVPNEVTREMTTSVLDNLVTMTGTLSELSPTITLEEFQAITKNIMNTLQNTELGLGESLEHATNTAIERATQSEDYFYDTDWETDREENTENDPNLLMRETNRIQQKKLAEQFNANRENIINNVAVGAGSCIALGESLSVECGSDCQLLVTKITPDQLDTPLTVKNISVDMNNLAQQLGLPIQEDIAVSAVVSGPDTNPYFESFGGLNADTLDFTIRDKTGNKVKIQNLEEPIVLGLPANSGVEEPPPDPQNISITSLPSKDVTPQAVYSFYNSVNLTIPGEGAIIRISGNNTKYLITYGLDYFTNYTMSGGRMRWVVDGWNILPQEKCGDRDSWVIDNDMLGNKIGKLVIGVRQLHEEELNNWNESSGVPPTPIIQQENVFTVDYEFSLSKVRCAYVDSNTNAWSSVGLTIGCNSTFKKVQCETRHASLFSAGIGVKPNPIDWSYVFSNMDFLTNPTLYVTQIIIALVYIISMIWARRMDKKDVQKLGVTPLPDNDPKDKYLYEMNVYTGMRKNAGTQSKVHFILTGENDETDVRILEDKERKVLQRGADDSFLVATSGPLGPLQYMRIWHDNSGKSKFASWFLKYIIVTDLQTKEKSFFLCDRWFAVEKDDGQVDRLLSVAGDDEMTQFSHLFMASTTRKIGDDHLWFSVVARPAQSRFTRCQRVSCCLLLLFTTMLADALFYGQNTGGEARKVFSLGPFALTPEQIYVGVIANLIVFPINFLVVILFRKSRPRKRRPNRIQEAIRKFNEEKKNSNVDLRSLVEEGNDNESLNNSLNDSMTRPLTTKGSTTKEKKPFSLPWWFKIISWIILWLGVLVSCAFITFYGVMFGDDKCKKWITSLLVSFLTSIFLTQPLQVLMAAALLSLIFKDPTIVDESKETEEDEEDIKLQFDEQYLHDFNNGDYGPARPRKIAYKPPDARILEEARNNRMKELQMYDILREVVIYTVFIWALLVISYNFRDPNGFLMREAMRMTYIDQVRLTTERKDFYGEFDRVRTSRQFWKWTEETLLPGLRASQWYNHKWLPGQRGFVADRVDRIMGYATMRQLRIKPALCDVSNLVHHIKECNVGYSFKSEDDTMQYYPGWFKTNVLNGTYEDYEMHSYKYSTAEELDGWPYWAEHGMYSGGGYTAELRGSLQKLRKHLKFLKDTSWIDRYTRAIFVEFTVYNPATNIFGIATIVAEFVPSGGIWPTFRFEPCNLLGYSMSTALFEIICQGVFMIFIIVFMVKESRKLKKEGRAYFFQFWSWIEMGIIFMSIGGAVIFFYRLIQALQMTKKFEESGGNAYMKFQYVGYWNELLLYMMGWVVFLATLKFLRILRFNRRMSMLASTLKHACWALMSFSLMFSIIFGAYVQIFYLIYLINLKNFYTLIASAETCMQIMLGRFNFYEMQKASPVMGPIFFFSYVMTNMYVLVNVFVSILNESFEAVRNDLNKQANDYEMVDFIMNKLKMWTGLGAANNANINQEKKTFEDVENEVDKIPDFDPFNPEDIERFPERVDILVRFIRKSYFPQHEWLHDIATKKELQHKKMLQELARHKKEIRQDREEAIIKAKMESRMKSSSDSEKGNDDSFDENEEMDHIE